MQLRYFGRRRPDVGDLIGQSERIRDSIRSAAIEESQRRRQAEEERRRAAVVRPIDVTGEPTYAPTPRAPVSRAPRPIYAGGPIPPPIPVPSNIEEVPPGAQVSYEGLQREGGLGRQIAQRAISPLAPESVTTPIAQGIGYGVRRATETGVIGEQLANLMGPLEPRFTIAGQRFEPIRHGPIPVSAGEALQEATTEEGQRIIPGLTSPLGIGAGIAFPEATAFGTLAAGGGGISGRLAEDVGIDPRLRVPIPGLGETNLGPRSIGEIAGGLYGGPGRALPDVADEASALARTPSLIRGPQPRRLKWWEMPTNPEDARLIQESLREAEDLSRAATSRWLMEHGVMPVAGAAPDAATLERTAQRVEAAAEPPTTFTRERITVPARELKFRPEIFQARDADAASAVSGKRVKQLTENFDLGQFSPPHAVRDPDTGELIVYRGHHRTEAFKQVMGPDAPIDVYVVNADIRDPEQLKQLILEGDASNFKTALPNFREQVKAVSRAETAGLTVDQIAGRLRKSVGEVEALQDANRLGTSVIDRVVAEPMLGPYATELGRGVRVYGIRPEDAAGWFNRIAGGPKGQRPTQTAVRDTIDKFGRALKDAPPEMFAGMEDLGGTRGGILEILDANTKLRTQLESEVRRVKGLQNRVAKIAKSPRASAADVRAAERVVKLGQREQRALEAEIAASNKDVLAAFKAQSGGLPAAASSSGVGSREAVGEYQGQPGVQAPVAGSQVSNLPEPSGSLSQRPMRALDFGTPVSATKMGKSKRLVILPRPSTRSVPQQLEELLARAKESNPVLQGHLESAAAKVGGTAEMGPLKTMQRAAEKVEKGGLEPAELGDLVRGSIVVPENKFDDALQALRDENVDILMVEPKTEPDKWLGYNGTAHVNVRLENGMLAEIQIESPQVAAVAHSAEAHSIYEQWRAINFDLTRVSPEEQVRLEALATRSKQMYADARAAAQAEAEAAGGARYPQPFDARDMGMPMPRERIGAPPAANPDLVDQAVIGGGIKPTFVTEAERGGIVETQAPMFEGQGPGGTLSLRSAGPMFKNIEEPARQAAAPKVSQQAAERASDMWVNGEPLDIKRTAELAHTHGKAFEFPEGSVEANNNAARTLIEMVGEAPTVPELWRGVSLNPQRPMYTVGQTFDDPLSSWTTRRDLAQQFATEGYGGGTPVLFRVTDAKAARLVGKVVEGAEEHISQGRFRVVSVEPVRLPAAEKAKVAGEFMPERDGFLVELKQEQVFDVPEALGGPRPATNVPEAAAQAAAPPPPSRATVEAPPRPPEQAAPPTVPPGEERVRAAKQARLREEAYSPTEPPPPPEPPTTAAPPPPPPIGDPIEKLTTAIRNAGKATPEQRAMFAQERAQRTAIAASSLERGIAKGEGAGAFAKARGSLKGEFPRPQFAVPAFTEGDMHTLLQQIGQADVPFYSKIGAQEALEDLARGRIPEPAQLAALKDAIGGKQGAELVKAVLSKRPLSEKIWAEVVSSLGLPQAFKAAYDFGTRFRQGLVLGWSHPRQWLSNWKPAADSMFSETAAQEVMSKLEKNRWYSVSKGERAGLGFTDVGGHVFKWESLTPGPERVEGFTGLNESFIQRLVNKIPGIQGSQRSFAVDLNKAGVEVYAQEAEALWNAGLRDPEQFKALASVINHARGYGAFRPGQIVQGVNAFFSPRNLVARFQVALDPLMQPGSLFKPSARRLAAKNLVGMVAGDMSVLGLIAAGGALTGMASVEFSPTKPGADWLKVRVGNTRIDPWGGFLPMARLIARMGAATLTETGVKDTGWDYPRATAELRSFFQNKEAPLVRVFTDAVGISQPFGDPSLLKPSALANLFAPFVTQDIWDAVKEHGWGGIAAGIPAAVGIGVQTYQVPSEERNRLAQDRFGKDYNDLDVDEKRQIDAEPKMQDLNRQIDVGQRQRGDKYQEAQDTFEAAAAPIRERQAMIDAAAQRGDMDISKWRDENRVYEAQLAQARTDAYKDIDFQRDTNPEKQPIRAALDNYYAITADQYRDPRTQEVDWQGFFDARDQALSHLTPAQRATAEAETEKNLTPFQRQFREAQRLMGEAPSKYAGLNDTQADRVDEFVKAVGDMVPTLREQLKRDVSPSAVARILAPKFAGDGLSEKDIYFWFKKAGRSKYRNPDFYHFLKRNASVLALFFPQQYQSQAYQRAAGTLRPSVRRPDIVGTQEIRAPASLGGAPLTQAVNNLYPISVTGASNVSRVSGG